MIIGTVCLHDIRFAAYSCTEIGYKFDAAFRRMGYASEAIKKSCHLPFTTFIFIVYSHVLCRKQALHLPLESLGFQYEGVERGCFLSRTDGQIICATRISTLPPTINSCIFMHSPCQKRLHFVRQLFLKKTIPAAKPVFNLLRHKFRESKDDRHDTLLILINARHP